MFSYHTGEKSEGLEVLQNVTVLGGDEDHVELLQRLVHVSNAVRFHKRVLLACVHQFRESSQKTLDSCSGHFDKLPRHDGLTGLGAHCCCQQHLQGEATFLKKSLQTFNIRTRSKDCLVVSIQVRSLKVNVFHF